MEVLVNDKEYPHIRVGLGAKKWVELHGELFVYYNSGAISVQTSLVKLMKKHNLDIDDDIIELFKECYNG